MPDLAPSLVRAANLDFVSYKYVTDAAIDSPCVRARSADAALVKYAFGTPGLEPRGRAQNLRIFLQMADGVAQAIEDGAPDPA